MNKKNIAPIIYALIAAVFYALNMPASKILLKNVSPTMMAALLYLGAGIGIGAFYILGKKYLSEDTLEKKDLPYTAGMILLDMIAPILLMFGLLHTSAANASLLNNFEIVSTTLIAFIIFKETISKKLWIAILLITLSSILLSVEDIHSLNFSGGSIPVIAATICWGFENNCTKKIASKNSFEIVMLKGLFSGIGAFAVGTIIGEQLPTLTYGVMALLLGFVTYGLSILYYIKAQNNLGAAKTSAYYAVAPFIGALLSFIFFKESLSSNYLLALFFMVIGTVITVSDTITLCHRHIHTHISIQLSGEITQITHSHIHFHLK